MEGFPKKQKSEFAVIPGSDIGYGESIRRVETLPVEEEKSVPDNLDDTQRADLRETLRKVGIQVKPEVDENRRMFLRRSIALAGATLVGGSMVAKKIFDNENNGEEEIDSANVIKGKIINEGIESKEDSSNFETELKANKEYLTMPKDAILFVNEKGLPVGKPVKFQDIVGPKYNSDGSLYMKKYRFTAGKEMNEIGIPEEGIAPEWMSVAEQIQQRKYPNQKIVGRLHVTGEFMAGYNRGDSDLQEKVESGEVASLAEMVDFLGDQKVVEAPGLSRKDYLRTMVTFADYVPPVVQEEVRRLLPGLSAKESKFSDAAVSPHGAKGALQFMPDTWVKDLKADPEKITSFTEQVKMVGEFTSRQYRSLFIYVGESKMGILQDKFSDEDSFYRDLIVPLLINAHNTGAKGMADVVSAYVEVTPAEEMPTGKDLYTAIADFGKSNHIGGYGDDAREYAMMIYAYTDELSV